MIPEKKQRTRIPLLKRKTRDRHHNKTCLFDACQCYNDLLCAYFLRIRPKFKTKHIALRCKIVYCAYYHANHHTHTTTQITFPEKIPNFVSTSFSLFNREKIELDTGKKLKKGEKKDEIYAREKNHAALYHIYPVSQQFSKMTEIRKK